MELGMLYEFEAPKPWAGDHPWGQRTAERKAYKDCIEQIGECGRVVRVIFLFDFLGSAILWTKVGYGCGH